MLPSRKLLATKDQRLKTKGFTLIEMLVVIAIISILIGIGINTFTIAQQKARDVRRKADLAAIQKALFAYSLDHNGSYCPTGSSPSCSGDITSTSTTPLDFLKTGGYLSSIPTPPTSAATDKYRFNGNATDFSLSAPLENKSDPDGNKTYSFPSSCGPSGSGSVTLVATYCVGGAL